MALTLRSYESELNSYNGNDKLGLWVQYLKWYQTALPSASKQTQVVELLERCTNDLFDVEKYKRDTRMLRIWIRCGINMLSPTFGIFCFGILSKSISKDSKS